MNALSTDPQSMVFVAQALSRNTGIDVRCGGTTAYCHKNRDGGFHINIPLLAQSSDAQTKALAYVGHEAGHIRFTDMDTMPKDKLLRQLVNILEDQRIEYLMGANYKGLRDAFDALNDELFCSEKALDHLTTMRDIPLAVAAITYYGYNLPQAKNIIDNLNRAKPGLWDELEPLTHLPQKTFAEVLDHANQIIDILKRYFPQPDQDAGGNGDPSEGDGDGSGNGNSQNQQGQQGQDQSQGQGQGNNQSQKNPSQGNKSGSSMPNLSDNELAQIKELDKGKMLAEALNQESIDAIHHPENNIDDTTLDYLAQTGGLSSKKDSQCRELDHMNKSEALLQSTQLNRRLLALLQAKVRAHRIGTSGRLSSPHLSRLAVGDTRIFQALYDKAKVNAEVALVCDSSGSMYGRSIRIESQAAYALAVALSQIRGVTTATYAFSGKDFITVQPFGRPTNTCKWLLPADDGTLAGFALQKTLQIFRERMARPNAWPPKRVIIVLTDGQIQDEPIFRANYKLAERLGIKVLGLGIGMEFMVSDCPIETTHIQGINELSQALNALVLNELLGG